MILNENTAEIAYAYKSLNKWYVTLDVTKLDNSLEGICCTYVFSELFDDYSVSANDN